MPSGKHGGTIVEHDAAAVAQASLVLNAALMKFLVEQGTMKNENLSAIIKDAAESVSGIENESAVIAVLNTLIEKPA